MYLLEVSVGGSLGGNQRRDKILKTTIIGTVTELDWLKEYMVHGECALNCIKDRSSMRCVGGTDCWLDSIVGSGRQATGEFMNHVQHPPLDCNYSESFGSSY